MPGVVNAVAQAGSGWGIPPWIRETLESAFPVPSTLEAVTVVVVVVALCLSAYGIFIATRDRPSKERNAKTWRLVITALALLLVSAISMQWLIQDHLIVFHPGSNCSLADKTTYVSVLPLRPSSKLRPFLRNGSREPTASCEEIDQLADEQSPNGIVLTASLLELSYLVSLASTGFLVLWAARSLWLSMPAAVRRALVNWIDKGRRSSSKAKVKETRDVDAAATTAPTKRRTKRP